MKHPRAHALGDFTTDRRMIPISALAVLIGLLSTGVAWLLLRLIGLFTNLFYYHRWDPRMTSPAGNHLGAWAILVPVAGSLLIGLMARYGSERIRGHGIPEAIESILINGSRVQPRLAFLKPLSSAISIGSGGPFGAEGPIIMTGGAFGSMIAQFFHLTSVERKTLLVAGAAAGMSATFASPVAAVLLAVELLLFEWKPRSLVPVALASATAGAARRYILGLGPLFPVPQHPTFIGPEGLLGCAICGLLAGVLSMLLTGAVYAAEDAFAKLPIHWMWWPAIGGLVVGLGGLVFPQALGVGYDSIAALLQGSVAPGTIAGILLVKSVIWAVALGSGTSGGVLAPLLMMGGALGGIEAMFLPNEGVGFWPLLSMGAILGGTMRSPLTGIIFALELTHDINMLLPLLAAGVIAHGFTVLTLKRSILTEKVARRGYHLSREYAVDPLEILFVRDAMRTNLVAFNCDSTLDQVRDRLSARHGPRGQFLYPVLDGHSRLFGVITRKRLQKLLADPRAGAPTLAELVTDPVVAYPDEPLRVVVYRMAELGLTRFPVVDRADHRKLLGIIGLRDLLSARTRNLEEERNRERVLRIRLPIPGRDREAALDTGRDAGTLAE
ncbi:MAG TPA: chloride channel protein [Bryobacteraceae bacterium]|nr:chloride channel protein [Bryobacteraceae bacterium]